MLKKLWESIEDGDMDSIDMKVRIVKFENEFSLEILSRDENDFWERLKLAWKYLIKNARVMYSYVPLNKEDIRRLSKLEEELD